jgi:hypothetical protein
MTRSMRSTRWHVCPVAGKAIESTYAVLRAGFGHPNSGQLDPMGHGEGVA